MTNLTVLEPVKLTVIGLVAQTGTQVRLGQVALVSPEQREEQVEGLLSLIDAAIAEERLCNMGTISFNPGAFDVYMVV